MFLTERPTSLTQAADPSLRQPRPRPSRPPAPRTLGRSEAGQAPRRPVSSRAGLGCSEELGGRAPAKATLVPDAEPAPRPPPAVGPVQAPRHGRELGAR